MTGALAALALVSAMPQLGGAATVARLDLATAIHQSDAIVHGRVASTHPLWSDDGLRIYTDARIDVIETLAGSPAPQVTVRLLGGEIGRIGQMAPGAPRLAAGEEVVLLLQQSAQGDPGAPLRIVGLAQGLFRVRRDAGKAPAAIQDLGDLHLVDVAAPGARTAMGVDGPPPAAGTAASVELPLSDLLATLRAAAIGGGR